MEGFKTDGRPGRGYLYTFPVGGREDGGRVGLRFRSFCGFTSFVCMYAARASSKAPPPGSQSRYKKSGHQASRMTLLVPRSGTAELPKLQNYATKKAWMGDGEQNPTCMRICPYNCEPRTYHHLPAANALARPANPNKE